MRKPATTQTEKAFAAYVYAGKTGILAPVSVHAGQSGLFDGTAFRLIQDASGSPVVVTPPVVILVADQMKQMGLDSGLYEGRLRAIVETQADDEQAAEDLHSARVEAVRDWLEDFTTVAAAMNQPATGPDTRVVKDFTVSALVYQDERPYVKERSLYTELSYYVFVCPQDPVTG